MKTREEVKKEIEALKVVRPNVRPHSIFGDDNLAQLDVQIMVLEGDMDNNDISDMYDHAGADESVLEAAFYARQWIEGKVEDDSLTEGWPLIKEKT